VLGGAREGEFGHLEIYRLAAAYVEDAAVHQGYAETLDVTASCPVMEAARAAGVGRDGST